MGYSASRDAGPGKQALGGVGCMLKSSATGVTVMRCVTLLKLPIGRPPPGGGSGRKGRRPVEPPGLPGTGGAAGTPRLTWGVTSSVKMSEIAGQ